MSFQATCEGYSTQNLAGKTHLLGGDRIPRHGYDTGGSRTDLLYIEGGVGMGIWVGRPELTEITGKVAEKFLPDLTYIRLATPEESEAYKQREARRAGAAGAML